MTASGSRHTAQLAPYRSGLHAVVAQQQQRHVVLPRVEFAEQFVGHFPRIRRIGPGERGAGPVHALVQRQVDGLDEAVGDHDDHRAGGQGAGGHGELRVREDAQRESALDLYLLGPAVGVAQERCEVPGPYEQGVALLHVQLGVAAGGEQIGLHTDEEPVGVRDDHVGRMALHGVRPDRGTHLAHDRRGSGAVSLDVTDDERHPVLGEGYDVVPVTAHLQPRFAGR